MPTRLMLLLTVPLSVVACDSPEPPPASPKPAAMVVVPAGSATFRPVIPDRSRAAWRTGTSASPIRA